MAKLVSLEEIAKVLNRTKNEVLDLVDNKTIPFLRFNEGTANEKLSFPLEEVLATISPKKKRAKEKE